jgi:SAM-dependent methyltransferase
MSDVHDRWAAGSVYEEFMGRWSRRLAPRFVSWLRIPAGAHWLDVGCGTGALANAVLSDAGPASVVGCDPAEALLEYARSRSRDPRVAFIATGVGALPRRQEGYGSIASLFALNFFPEPGAAIQEMRSLAAPGGVISACVWDYQDGMEFLRRFWDAASALDPAARELHEGRRFPLCRPDALENLFRGGGLEDVRCEAIEITTEFAGFDDLWQPFLGGTGPAPSYVATLDEDRRAALARTLEQSLPKRPGGAIELTARAWAVRGRSGETPERRS